MARADSTSIVRASRKAPRAVPRRRAAWLIAGTLVLVAVLLGTLWPRQVAETPESLRADVERALQEKQWEKAEQAIARLTAGREPTAEDEMLRARLAVDRERPDEAIAALNRIPDADRLASVARLLAGQIELRRNRIRIAESYLLQAIERDPNQIQARRELIFIYGMQLRRDAITAQFRELSKSTPLTYEQAFLWCLIRGNKWQAGEQARTLQKYLKADPEDRWSRLALSDCYAVLIHFDEAEALLEPLADDDPEALERRAKIALARGELERVEQLLSGAPESHAGLARLRGALALQQRDATAAIQYFQQALQQEPDHRDAIFGIARAYTLAGDQEKAEPYREVGRRLDEVATLLQYASTKEARKDPKLAMKLGMACEAAGRFPEARAWYHLIITGQDPLNREAQQALYRLNQVDDAPAQDGNVQAVPDAAR